VIDTLAAMPERVRALVSGVCDEELSRKPAPDVFSLRENVLHLRDIDVEGYEKRVLLLLNESDPFLPDLDGARLAEERDYNNQPLEPALDAFAASRARSISRLRDADLDRSGSFEGVGRVTLRQLLELWVEHDAGHLKEMQSLRGLRVSA
jgi:hypothetical protein